MRRFLTKKITRSNLDPFVAKHASDGYTLDLGCSEAKYAEHFPNRVGFDIQKRKGVDVVGDAHDMPFKDNEFDAILCTEVLEHLHTPEVSISEMRRVLKPGGKLILTTRFIFPIHDAPHDYFRFTKYGLRHLFSKWDIEELREETSSQGALAVLLQTLMRQSEVKGGKFTKAIAFFIAQLIYRMPKLTRVELGNGRNARRLEEENLLTSGYYLVAKNIK